MTGIHIFIQCLWLRSCSAAPMLFHMSGVSHEKAIKRVMELVSNATPGAQFFFTYVAFTHIISHVALFAYYYDLQFIYDVWRLFYTN